MTIRAESPGAWRPTSMSMSQPRSTNAAVCSASPSSPPQPSAIDSCGRGWPGSVMSSWSGWRAPEAGQRERLSWRSATERRPGPRSKAVRSSAMGDELKLTLLERTKIQAEVLNPLVRAMEDDIGREEAHRLVRQALGDQVRESIRTATPTGGSRDTVEWLLRFSQAGDALDLDRLDGAAPDSPIAGRMRPADRWHHARPVDVHEHPASAATGHPRGADDPVR